MVEGEIRTWGDLERACNLVGVTLEQAIGATLSTTSDEGDAEVELDIVYDQLDAVRQELVDQAHSGNLARKHHLESAVSLFEDIGTLLRAEEIIRQAFDPREEIDELSEDDHGSLHDSEGPES